MPNLSKANILAIVNKANISLAHFIIIQVFLFLFIIALILSRVVYSDIKRNMEEQSNNHINYITKVQSSNAAEHLWNNDKEGLETIATDIIKEPYILAARIAEHPSNSPPHTLVEAGSIAFPKEQSPNVLKFDLKHTMPDGESLKNGLFQVYIDYEGIENKATLQTTKIFTIATLLYALMLVMLYLTLKKSLAPLAFISSQLKETKATNINLKRPLSPITKEIKTLFDALDNMREKIHTHQQTLIKSKKQAEHANRIKDDFMANISHELRTPLNSIIGITRFLDEEKNLDKEQREMVTIVKKSSISLLNLVNDLLDISKIESGNIVLEHEPFSLKHSITDVSQSFMPLCSEKGLTFTIKADDLEKIVVMGDYHRLYRIITNLCGNAIKYTEKGHVKIHCDTKEISPEKIEFICTVEDTGIGIPQDRLESIFDKFIQAEGSTERRFGGTGLGLCITKHLVELMEGHIKVESKLEEGTKFTIRIPFTIANIKNPELYLEEIKEKTTIFPNETAGTVSPSPAKKGKFKDARVLIAEDHELNQILIKKLVSKMGCSNSNMVFNGYEATQAYENGKYDLIFMDCHMPEMNGTEATKAIRKFEEENKIDPPVIIIALTADAMTGAREECLKRGMDGYLSKPIDDQLLKEIVKQWFDLS